MGPGLNADAGPADLARRYQYSYDLAGNRLAEMVTVGSTPVTTNYSYNAANQLVSDGTHTLTYDNNGNLTNDGVNTYTWDRANRLRSMGGLSYGYDGLGNRVWQSNGLDVTQYLLDVPPGLAVVLSATTSTDTTRYVHGPRGLHAQQDISGNWNWMVQDGLGSVRSVADDTLTLLESRQYAPYGEQYGVVGVPQTVYGFTGEPTDANALVYLRARYLNPTLGVFASRDLWEGQTCSPMSLNGYSWVEGNTSNAVDHSGNSLTLISALNAGGCAVGGYLSSKLLETTITSSHVLKLITQKATLSDQELLYDAISRETRDHFREPTEYSCLLKIIENDEIQDTGGLGDGIFEQAQWLTWTILNRYAWTREQDYQNYQNSDSIPSCENATGTEIRYCHANSGLGIRRQDGSVESRQCPTSYTAKYPSIQLAVDSVVRNFRFRTYSDPTRGAAGWRGYPATDDEWYRRTGNNYACEDNSGHLYGETVEQFFERINDARQRYIGIYPMRRHFRLVVNSAWEARWLSERRCLSQISGLQVTACGENQTNICLFGNTFFS